MDAERLEVTPGVEFRKLVLGVNGTVALAADTKEWRSGEEVGNTQ